MTKSVWGDTNCILKNGIENISALGIVMVLFHEIFVLVMYMYSCACMCYVY